MNSSKQNDIPQDHISLTDSSDFSIDSQQSKFYNSKILGKSFTPPKLTFKDLLDIKRNSESSSDLPKDLPIYHAPTESVTPSIEFQNERKINLDSTPKTSKKKAPKIHVPKLIKFNKLIDDIAIPEEPIREYQFLRNEPLILPKKEKNSLDLNEILLKCQKEKQDKGSYYLAKNVLTDADNKDNFVIEAPERVEGFISKKISIDPREIMREKLKNAANERKTSNISNEMLFNKPKTELEGGDFNDFCYSSREWQPEIKEAEGEIDSFHEDHAKIIPEKNLCTQINEKIKKAAKLHRNEIKPRTRNGLCILSEWHEEIGDLDQVVNLDINVNLSKNDGEDSLKRKINKAREDVNGAGIKRIKDANGTPKIVWDRKLVDLYL
ncbi:unnamed protein product [Blepharisma stoltei]|uniref:Uncharacterized protein n=1 Tax=Blepharisma stoltei TaxID=1481888 RepID=A0AAU9ITC4_9CILI|nr:unnamed protein product [Blepharisma stoltei]